MIQNLRKKRNVNSYCCFSPDEDGSSLVVPLMSVPSRKKQPQYYQVVKEPIDLSMIKQRVKTGYYDHLSSFNSDLMLLFSNVEVVIL